jgi:hypothetical protein
LKTEKPPVRCYLARQPLPFLFSLAVYFVDRSVDNLPDASTRMMIAKALGRGSGPTGRWSVFSLCNLLRLDTILRHWNGLLIIPHLVDVPLKTNYLTPTLFVSQQQPSMAPLGVSWEKASVPGKS